MIGIGIIVSAIAGGLLCRYSLRGGGTEAYRGIEFDLRKLKFAELATLSSEGLDRDCIAAYKVGRHHMFYTFDELQAVPLFRIASKCSNANARSSLISLLVGKAESDREVDSLLYEIKQLDPKMAEAPSIEIALRRTARARSGQYSCAQSATVQGQAYLRRLVEKLRTREIDRIEILWRNSSAESRSTITPDLLDKLYYRKAIISAVSSNNHVDELIMALEATNLTKMGPLAEGDVRWAIKFFEKRCPRPFVSLYLDGTGETGTVDAVQYSFNKPLHEWLNRNFFSLQASSRRGAKRD